MSIGVLVLFAYLLFGPILAAHWLEGRRRERAPDTKPYTWGYWRGCAGLSFGILGLASIVWLGVLDELDTSAFGGGVLAFCIWGIPGIFVIRRHKWAWVVSAIMTLNPIFWIIDGIYGARRWDEFVP